MVETDPDVKSPTEAPLSKIEFDVDEYIKPYKGRPALLRLIHIIQTSDSTVIRTRASELARTEVETLTDARLYASTISLVATASGSLLQPDQQRLRELQMEARELIRGPETVAFRIRRLRHDGSRFETRGKQNLAYLALAQAYDQIGQTSEAYEFYRKVNVHCKDWTPEMTAKPWLGILLMYLSYGIVKPTWHRTGTALEILICECELEITQAQKKCKETMPQTELDATFGPAIACCGLLKALMLFTRGKFDQAAPLFLELGNSVCEDVEAVMAPKDLAVLATLCSLAIKPPFESPSRLANDEAWGALLKRFPFVSRLLKAALSGDAEGVVRYFECTADFFLLDPFICQQAQPLAEAIVRNVLLSKTMGS